MVSLKGKGHTNTAVIQVKATILILLQPPLAIKNNGYGAQQ